MPTVQPGAKVLVTGANGFVAFWLVRQLLEKGYSVRGTVRSIKKNAYIKEYFKSYGERFELVEVSDFTKPGAFGDALRGVDAVEHTASPASYKLEDPEDFIRPAVDGTVGLLTSALEHGSNLKRVVITSSTDAVKLPSTYPSSLVTFNEKDWNDEAIKEVRSLGKAAAGETKYAASKILAEKAAWEFYEKHKNTLPWDLSVIIPPYVYGPVIHDVSTPAQLNVSAYEWWKAVVETGPQSKEEALAGINWIDVRDLATAHIVALEKEDAGGERIIAASGSSAAVQDWINAASSLDPSPLPGRKLPTGYPQEKTVHFLNYDVSKAARILGISYRTMEETTKDILADFAARGW